jgi:hypothetical protein
MVEPPTMGLLYGIMVEPPTMGLLYGVMGLWWNPPRWGYYMGLWDYGGTPHDGVIIWGIGILVEPPTHPRRLRLCISRATHGTQHGIA